MHLLLDVGNTRCKWRLSNGKTHVDRGAIYIEEKGAFELLFASIAEVVKGHKVSINVSCVAGAAITQKISRLCRNYFSAESVFAAVMPESFGVKVAYDRVENLGVDRWLAMLAAHKLCNAACTVIDAGSAITVDYLSENGEHSGGLIVPGVSLMRESLFGQTSAVKVEKISLSPQWRPGRDTVPCVDAGLSAIMKGFIEQIDICPSDRLFVTGGDAELLKSFLPVRAEFVSDLVLDGLQILS